MEPFSIGAVTRATAEVVRGLPRVFSLGREVRTHDRQALRIYEDLTDWARDDLRKQGQALDASETELAARGMLQSGQRGASENQIRTEVAERWRNRSRQAERDLEDLRGSETVLHRRYRNLRKRPWPTNPAQEEIDRITHGWEQHLE